MGKQQTLAGPALCAGVGLHTGAHTRLALKPAPVGSGIVFRCVGGDRDGAMVKVSPDSVIDTRLCTVIGDDDGPILRTVEHVLAAVAAAQLDNVVIEVDGPEAPALDGSAKPFMDLIRRAGLRRQSAPRRVLDIVKPVAIDMGDGRWARFEPCDRFEIDVTIAYDAAPIGRQRVSFVVEPETFDADISAARTFAFAEDVEAMRAAGLARGGSLGNCVVVEDGAVINADGLRYGDEFVRHKALDALGDLALLGYALRGRYVAERPGHALNNTALRALVADTAAWRIVEEPVSADAPRRERRHQHAWPALVSA